MKVAIVILNWNGKQLLEQFLPSIMKHSSAEADIYVADNNSNDDSVSFVQENYPQVKIIRNAENGGYAKGYNDALPHIDADIYCLVNSDIEVTKGWLSPVINQFERHPEVAVIQPKILDYKDKTKFEYAGAAGGFIDSLGYPYCRGRLFNTLEEDTGQYNGSQEIFWASGACFFVRSEVFHQLKGFDEDYFAHQEEIDFCWRIHNAGHKVHFVSESRVYHVGGATLSSGNPRKTFLNFRNSLFTLVKNLPEKKLVRTIFTRMLLDGVAALKFLIELKPRHFWAVFKAHLSFYRLLPLYLSKRKEQLTKKEHYFHSKCIVWNYYIAGKKRFSQLQRDSH
ncbi:MAG: glycosyltransferase family 2 protein [Flavobacteriaceae bacterium]|nr:glycosyltransferase family 2 protein [Flavobacteriaceae bacterium]